MWVRSLVGASPAAPSSPHRGFYADDDICERCSFSCRTCEGNATNCQSCRGGLVLDQGVCRESCPERHVAMDGVCKRCPELCQDCIHEKTCKGTWEPHRGEGGPTIWEWDVQEDLGETVCMPLLKLTSMGVSEKTEGDIKPFHDGFCKFRQTRAHFFTRFLPHTSWAVRVWQALSLVLETQTRTQSACCSNHKTSWERLILTKHRGGWRISTVTKYTKVRIRQL